ncbi:hypothetical protein [Corynebacterium sp. NML120713]|uniref:hypothetical protein n=1 Tax=Corynebacterium sp. NML120713 TaxID=1906332 RepID=UPI0008FB9B23|nr:hypothetical protein [Corynebacterium sp. NML120713]OIR42896.1 hypothetical protein BJP06_07775 [Corynebacterium sp. NML120713]
MKHSLLALTVASAVSVTAVQAPVAWSEETQQAAPDKANSSGSSDGEELSPAAIAGITLGVLAAVGAGAAFAVSQGLIPNVDPKVVAGLTGLSSTVPGLAALGFGGASINKCSPQAFDAAMPGWPGVTGTTVMYCEGQWAVAGQKQSDWIVPFERKGDRWVALLPDGTSKRGLNSACYNGDALRGRGAPQQFVDKIRVCAPDEIGR